jgi:hypothetical protein
VAQQPAAAVRAEHDQARVVLDGGLHDALPGWCRFDGDAPRPEPGVVRKRRPVVGGPLSGSPDLGGLVGVELFPVGPNPGCATTIGPCAGPSWST